ncbi:hypothetical protein BJY01DRAFT_146729 [Aspergillus pseudoustus]|uniref:Uncharacterized protein n=1 Tax=Aspergillus pseudoustus TaxID=1810923 RepID=A0ABR4KAQ2_9EURO
MCWVLDESQIELPRIKSKKKDVESLCKYFWKYPCLVNWMTLFSPNQNNHEAGKDSIAGFAAQALGQIAFCQCRKAKRLSLICPSMHADFQESLALWCGVIAQSRGTRQASSPKASPTTTQSILHRAQAQNPHKSSSPLPSHLFAPLALLQRFWSLPYLADSSRLFPPTFSLFLSSSLSNPHTGPFRQLQGNILCTRHPWRRQTILKPGVSLTPPQPYLRPSHSPISWSLRSVSSTLTSTSIYLDIAGYPRGLSLYYLRQPWAKKVSYTRISFFSLPPGKPFKSIYRLYSIGKLARSQVRFALFTSLGSSASYLYLPCF